MGTNNGPGEGAVPGDGLRKRGRRRSVEGRVALCAKARSTAPARIAKMTKVEEMFFMKGHYALEAGALALHHE